MKVLIVEDVILVAERIADLCKKYIEGARINICHTLQSAQLLISEETFDLMLLDLNLNGQDGFDLLEEATAAAFHTIIITANREQAVRAFDYGVFDFLSKPISEERFEKAIGRYRNNKAQFREQLKYLSIKSKSKISLLPIDQIKYIKASGNYSLILNAEGKQFLHDKNIDKLLHILPQNFIRVHRSYILPQENIKEVIKHGGGKYTILLNSEDQIPLSREVYKQHFM